MDEIMKRLSEMILLEMERKNQSCLRFSELCGVGKDVVGGIINGKKKDVKLSTVMRICENSDIKMEDIFFQNGKNPGNRTFPRMCLIIDGERYSLEIKGYKEKTYTPHPMQQRKWGKL